MTEVQRNNPLHGVKLEALVTELVEHYGWEALADEFNFNCFKSNPSIKSSLKFLRRTPWAREKIESFFLYQYKGLPRPPEKEEEISPRDRIIPEYQKPGAPKAIRPRPKRDDRSDGSKGKSSNRGSAKKQDGGDVWSHWRK